MASGKFVNKTLYLGNLLLSIFVFSGCFVKKATKSIDPPPPQVEKSYYSKSAYVTGTNYNAFDLKNAKFENVQLYFATKTGYIVPYTIKIPCSKDKFKECLNYMVKKGPGEKLIPKDFQCVLPENTKVLSFKITNGKAIVDFSKEFLNYSRDMETKILSAITWSLTEFDNIKEVDIKVLGKDLRFMPKSKTKAYGLTRKMGINLETPSGVDISSSIPVTLYFLAQNSLNENYFVPVTRLIQRPKNIGEAVLKELIKGPSLYSNLVSVVTNTLKVNKVLTNDTVAMADFDEQLLEYSDEKKASKMAINSIVLSLTENTRTKKVKITVNGKKDLYLSGSNKTLVQPVLRPVKVNPSGF